MAISPVIPKNGSVVLGSQVANFSHFTISASQSVEDITGYSNSNMSQSYGNGTQDWSMDVGAFQLAHAANTAPNLVSFASYGGATGAATTFTIDTGCSESGVAVVSNVRLTHARMRAAVPIAYTMKNGYNGIGSASDWTEAWATT